jgi:hypothetical protein
MTAILVSPAAIIGLAVNAVVGVILFFGADGFTRTAYRGSGERDSTVSD